jgi:two-component system, NarL family, sensor kinase
VVVPVATGDPGGQPPAHYAADVPTPRDGIRQWIDLTGGPQGPVAEHPLHWRRMVASVAAVSVLVFIAVLAAGSLTARRVAEREAVNDALKVTDLLSQSVVQPAIENDLLSSDPVVSGAAVARLDAVVRNRVLSDEIVRVKLWDENGRIVYSDESRLVGQVFPLGEDELDALRNPVTKGEISDLDEPENRFERVAGDKLLEVYRPIWAPDGRRILFETYAKYDAVTARSSQLWRGFGGITLSSMLLLLLAQAPLTWALLARLRRAQSEREAWLAQAVSASDEERRRIAATLHDGAVQELAASAFLVAGAADRVRSTDDDSATVRQLDLAAESVRSSIGGLRSLLVDIYPPSLRDSGISAALKDLVAPMRTRDTEVGLWAPERTELPPAVEALVFRVAQECLRNIVKHADASTVEVRLTVPTDESEPVLLEIADDGAGFDPELVLARPPEGHFGLRLMTDQAASAGATLRVASAPGRGTRWRLEVPR